VVFLLCLLPINIKIKNIILIIASLFFYAYGEPIFVFIMIISSLINYLFGLMLSGEKGRKAVLVAAVVLNISILGFFKYTNFIVDNINAFFHAGISIEKITLPIGISFFTFQAMSYVIDVYRNPKLSQKNYLSILLYISMFPQLVAGPIVRYSDINEQINNRNPKEDEIVKGIMRFSKGLFKKMYIANVCGTIADNIYGLDINKYAFYVAWLGAIVYALQIYYDFSAYSDMAIGLGHMFGFKFKENFAHPYSAVSIKDFWSKWHISLSTWFKEYVYIPLGGNRKGKVKTESNKMIVFLLTGIWHGANWTFIFWGLIHGVANVLEDTILPIRKLKNKVIGNIYTVLVAVVAFVFFRADSLKEGFGFVKVMFTGFHFDRLSLSVALGNLSIMNVITIIIGIICAYPVFDKIKNKYFADKKMGEYIAMAGSFILLFLCMIRLSSGSYNPFIYFRF